MPTQIPQFKYGELIHVRIYGRDAGLGVFLESHVINDHEVVCEVYSQREARIIQVFIHHLQRIRIPS